MPAAPGYARYVVEPHLGGLQWIERSVPAPQGANGAHATDAVPD
jgi:hypothetical protein